MTRSHFLKMLIAIVVILHCSFSFAQRSRTPNVPNLFYIDDESSSHLAHCNIPQDPGDTSLNIVFRKWGVVHVKEVIKTVMVDDYIHINLIELCLKNNHRKSYWKVEIEYVYDIPLKKERKNGITTRDKRLSYNFIYINAITGKVKSRSFKLTTIVCW